MTLCGSEYLFKKIPYWLRELSGTQDCYMFIQLSILWVAFTISMSWKCQLMLLTERCTPSRSLVLWSAEFSHHWRCSWTSRLVGFCTCGWPYMACYSFQIRDDIFVYRTVRQFTLWCTWPLSTGRSPMVFYETRHHRHQIEN